MYAVIQELSSTNVSPEHQLFKENSFLTSLCKMDLNVNIYTNNIKAIRRPVLCLEQWDMNAVQNNDTIGMHQSILIKTVTNLEMDIKTRISINYKLLLKYILNLN